MVIAIDGPGGVGKTTVSRAVARELGIPHLDTGATYRVATLAALRAGADTADEDAVLAAVKSATMRFPESGVYLDGGDVSAEIRGDAVTATVSAVAAMAEVRRYLVALQREWVIEHGGSAVVEGRDIGTVVFPNASVKVFLTADPAVRASRRARDAEALGRPADEIAADLERRDGIDSNREASPLQPADDAVVIDTTDLGLEAVLDRVLALVGDDRPRRHGRA